MFQLHPYLAQDTLLIGHFPLSLVLLHIDSHYPWCLLVPQREGIKEIHQLQVEDRYQLLEESCRTAEVMTELFAPDKMNVAALGNIVPQLHLHHVARFTTDAAWPKPIWGEVEVLPYAQERSRIRIEQLRQALPAEGLTLTC